MDAGYVVYSDFWISAFLLLPANFKTKVIAMLVGESIDIGIKEVAKLIIPFINAFIFFILSLIHFYWALGGKRKMTAVIPTKEATNEMIFVPSVVSTIIVAAGLLLFGCIEYGNTDELSKWVELKYFRWGNLLIAFIFFARAIGDFNYVGFFKRSRNTVFARNDTWYYSPLCLFISITSIFVALSE